MKLIFLLLSSAHLMPLLSWDWYGSGPAQNSELIFVLLAVLNIFSSIALLLRPRCFFLVVLILSWLGLVGIRMPFVPNHQVLLSLFDVLILLCLSSRKGPWEERVRAALPAIGIMVVGVYFFAAFVKLNTSFLSDKNCGGEFFGNIRTLYPFLPEISGGVLAWGTVLTEFLLSVLLALPRTRKTGALIGILFHAALGLDPVKRFYNFSSVMALGLVACLMWNTALRWKENRGEQMVLFALKSLLLSSLFIFVLYLLPDEVFFISFAQMTVTLSLFWCTFSILLFLLILTLQREGQEGSGSWLVLVFSVSLILLHGLSPYLGIKTGSSLTMYSNLTLTASESNHLLVPRSLDILGILKDEVILVEEGSEVSSSGKAIPYFELYRKASNNKDVPVLFRWPASKEILSKRFDELTSPPFWWAHRIIRFNEFSQHGEDCVW